MSLLAVAVVLAVVIGVCWKARWVNPAAGLACVLFGVVIAAGPVGPPLQSATQQAGAWMSAQLRQM